MSGSEMIGALPEWEPAGDGAAAVPAGTHITASPGLAEWLVRQRVSLAFTSYQSSHLFLVGVTPGGAVSFSSQAFGRAMGVAWRAGHLFLGALASVWRIENILRPGEMASRMHDAVFVPRVEHIVGDLDIHELGVGADGKPLFAATRFNCLATLDPVHSFRAIWKPPFITAIAQEDRCHLNGLAMDKGRPRYVTAIRAADEPDAWREGPDRGVLIDVERNRVLLDTLFMPHSPSVANGAVYFLESGRGMLVRLDPRTLEKTDIAFCPGFLRGLTLLGDYAAVTLSRPRKTDFDGVPLDGEIARRGTPAWCGVAIIDLRSGDTVEWLRLEGDIIQLFDVTVIPGVRCPLLLGPRSEDAITQITFDVSTLPQPRPQAQATSR